MTEERRPNESPGSAGAPPDLPSTLRQKLRSAWTRLRGGSLSPGRAALSVGVGLFVGCLPIYGAQLLIVLLICVPLKLDAAVAYIATHLNNPFTLPLFLWLELDLGSWMLTGHGVPLRLEDVKRLGLATAGAQIALGSAAAAVVLGGTGALVTWLVARGFERARKTRSTDAGAR